jgi:hypothetical protein
METKKPVKGRFFTSPLFSVLFLLNLKNPSSKKKMCRPYLYIVPNIKCSFCPGEYEVKPVVAKIAAVFTHQEVTGQICIVIYPKLFFYGLLSLFNIANWP